MNKLYFDDCLDELKILVDRFKNNIEDYKSSIYNEESTKIDFIDRFFALLGWDVNNSQNHSEEYREVVREDKVIIKGRPKSPDYSFRFGKEKLFFVEAKRPSVNIKDDTKPAYQVRRYAYSAGLNVSILTDFEEFAIYDTTVKPKENDKASIARVFYCKFDEYEKKWEFLQNTISKKAIVTGKFKDFVVKGKGKKGTQSIDKEILKMIESWRDVLARNIAIRNKQIDIYQLNEAVQKIIDRIIFLRMAEDRNTERYGMLTELAKNAQIYKKLVLYFNSSNKKYNSGLFETQKWLDELAIDDKIFTQIVADLYYPVPYEFSVLPIEILGHIYEQFLGKTIRLTQGHQAKVEEKPEVRKAGGVYYTPQYIVEYIVENTVGKKLGVLGIGDRVLDSDDNYLNNKGIENENISGTGHMERGNDSDRDDLQKYEEISEGGKIQPDQSDAEISGINTVEHSGRVRPGFSEGISLPSVGSKGISDGIGDTNNYSESSNLSYGGKHETSLESNANSGKTSYWAPEILKSQTQPSNSQTQTPKPNPLTPNSVAKLKILDPACGSGSFLVGAYKYLLEYHLKYWTDKKNVKKGLKEEHIYHAGENNYRLTTKTKRSILLDNIYGVDIDTQAVEVTKLSLLLTMMEGEIAEAGSELFYKDRKEALLPDLKDNIKCGNSLIGSDFYHEKDMQLFDTHEQRKINCFDWEVEFKEIMDAGGFDCVIGNPPYIKEYTNREIFENTKQSYLRKYYQGKMDIWYFFTCNGIDLLKENGLLGYIAPNNWITNYGASIMRDKVLKDTIIRTFIDFNDFKVFEDAGIQTMVFILEKDTKSEIKNYSTENIKILNKKIDSSEINRILSLKDNTSNSEYFKSIIKSNEFFGKSINFINKKLQSALYKIKSKSNYKLNDFNVAQGIVCPQDNIIKKHLNILKDESIKVGDGIFILKYNELCQLNLMPDERKILKPYYTTNELKKYYGNHSNSLWIIYSDLNIRKSINLFPNVKSHFDKFAKVITSDFAPYGLHRARVQKFFEGEKILSLRKSLKQCFTYTDFPCYVSQSYYSIKPNDINLKYLTGLLNSKLIYFWLYYKGKKQGEQLQIDKEPLLDLPLIRLDIKNKAEKAQHDRMVNLVEQMLEAQKQLHSDKSKTETDKKLLQQRIDILDKQIDTLVYELYGLTEEEIRIIEEV